MINLNAKIYIKYSKLYSKLGYKLSDTIHIDISFLIRFLSTIKIENISTMTEKLWIYDDVESVMFGGERKLRITSGSRIQSDSFVSKDSIAVQTEAFKSIFV